MSKEAKDIEFTIDSFNGANSDDYDLWWADMQAYFNINSFSDHEKLSLFNANLGGEALKYIQAEDVSNIDTVEKMDALLKSTFSKEKDWHYILMNVKQNREEDVRDFSDRLRLAARKCGFKGASLDTISIICLKRGCVPHFSNLLDLFPPYTPYDEIIENAIEFERNRKTENSDLIEDSDSYSLESKSKIAKIEMKQTKEFPNFKNPKKRGCYVNACLHCAKPNHRLNECETVSEAQKKEIQQLLREKKYDFKELIARSNKFFQNREFLN